MSLNHSQLPGWWPYLHYGYLPPGDGQLPFEISQQRLELPTNLGEAAAMAGELLARVIRSHLEPNRTHLIPLSGGLDSRALLAAAMEAGADVLAVTFGTPGTLDYEYGKRVAQAAGVRHECIPLPEVPLTTESLVKTVKAGGAWTYLFDACYNRILTGRFAEDCVVITGFIGDPVAGSHYRKEAATEEQVKEEFSRSQAFLRGSGMLLPMDVDPVEALPGADTLPSVPGLIPYEVLDFSVRQRGAIRPIVIDDRYDVRTPFTDSRWLRLMFSAPAAWRQGCRLYERALLSQWPELFRLPTKNHYGYGLHVSPSQIKMRRFPGRVRKKLVRTLGGRLPSQNRMLNYIDFGEAFMTGGHLHDLARENLCDLAKRDVVPWIEPEKFLERHTNLHGQYEKEIQLLIGLETNLKAQQ